MHHEHFIQIEHSGTRQTHLLPDTQTFAHVGKKKAGRVLDGRTHDEFPQVERGTTA